jgi:phosphohistidine swiveling domain-containing protein
MRADAVEVEPMTLLPLDRAGDERIAGRKAATLAMLRKQGFDIPDGFVIPAGVEPRREDIAAALATLGDGPVAVRSSGLAEDTDDASFAGQYDTMLNVRGVDAIVDAIAACVRSAQSTRVEGYGPSGGAMAVLVQRMVAADVSGVAFSANPVTGNRAEVRINVTKGLGDRLVGGEVDGDEWLVTNTNAIPVAQPQRAIDASTAMQIAALARKAEATRKAPQDIEWAIADGQIYLLQSRPITVLPVAPQIEVPKGTWQKDAGHFSEPVCPFTATTQLRHGDRILDDAIAKWGLLPDGGEFRIIGHEPYIHIDPDDGGKQPPPWWVLGAVVRIIPSMRKKLRASAAAVESGMLESVPAEWASHHRPRLDKQIREYAAIDLTAMDTDALFAHVDTLSLFYTDCLRLHFHLAIPYAVGLRDLAVACEELLGWDLAKAMSLLQGLSETSQAGTEDLAAIARQARPGSAARQILESRTPDFLARLDPIDPSLAGQLREYMHFWGLRPLGSEVGCPTVGEQPQLVADAIADILTAGTPQDFSAARTATRQEAQAKLTGDALQRFNSALAYAERIYALREDNVVLTDQMPIGLLRRVALEIGRRLVTKSQIGRTHDAVMLTADELREALRNGKDMRPLVSLRKSEHAWVRANPGPMTYGPEPGKAPDLRGLPDAARRINAGLIWMMEGELTPPQKSDGSGIKGLGASPGVHRGRVRVITTPEQLHTLRQGEVLVCPHTSAAWMMVFRRAGAIVADTGSVLSHTAIVAREFALPAVVGTGNGTSSLKDGEEVIVDGTRGVVTRC